MIKILPALLVILNIVGCANIQRPMGGPRDRTPPKLLLAVPANETRNFKAKEIKLDFDEYFKLNNQQQEITISPAMERTPEFKIRQKSLVISFFDTLQKNTTYVINFGKAIQDVNESNTLKNFTYVFSTGNHIDSLNVSGSVVNTLTQEKEKDATVMLIPIKQDTIWGKKKPSIFTSTDSSGNFSLSNLHDGNYRIYALKESSANRVYDNDAELVAFDKKIVHLDKDTANIQLSLFKQEPDILKITNRKVDQDGKMIFLFNRPLVEPGMHINYPAGYDDDKIVEFGQKNDSALVYMKRMDFDSISVSFTEKGKPVDTTFLKKRKNETYTRNLTLSYNLGQDVLKPGSDLLIIASQPLTATDQSRIVLLEDSAAVSNFTIQNNPATPRRSVLKYRWKQDRNYEVDFNEGTFTDIYGDKNKRLVKKFKIDKPENYGNLTLKITTPDTSSHYVIELLNEAKTVIRTDPIIKSGSITYKNYLAGKYRIRVVYDSNGNGRWDSGNIKQKRYPENIWLFPTIITLRPNWDMEQVVEIPKEVVTP